MKESKYLLSSQEGNKQPLHIHQIVEMIMRKEISPADSACVLGSSEWQAIIEIDEIMNMLRSSLKEKKSQENKSKSDSQLTHSESHLNNKEPKLNNSEQKSLTRNDETKNKVKPTDFSNLDKNPMLTEWYVLKGENKFGPFQYTEIIKMLQEKIVFEFDYIWKNGMSSWTRLAEVHDFKPEHIKKLQDSLMPEIKNVFFRRKHPRIPFESEVVVHDNNHFWTGHVVELSQGGAGIIMENSLLLPSQQLYIHFKSNSKMKAFNSVCEIVSKKFIEGIKRKESPICYGVKFVNISEEAFEQLQIYTSIMAGQKSA